MNIYIDESGSFVNAASRGAWNVVAAFVAPESSRVKVQLALIKLKHKLDCLPNTEVKLNHIDEVSLIGFLSELSNYRAVLFCTATDAGVNSEHLISAHKNRQIQSIRANIPRMHYDGGRRALEILANQIENIPNQLYVQLTCQVHLLYEVINRSINFYAQRIPGTLGSFRWRVDQKNTSKTDFESAFEKIAPALLQTKSIKEPMPLVEGFNYGMLKRYEFEEGVPDYLERDHGIHVSDALNLQKIVREDIGFVDSKSSVGVQIADILASATRRSLRGGFESNNQIASLLGRLMIQRSHGRPPIELICFGRDGFVDEVAERSVRAMHLHNQSLLT